MVVFICNACGESLKKNKVQAHYETKCPQCEVLSCMDCGKDFYGDAYNAHNSCVSEAEKYQGKLFKAPQKSQGKGARKQADWLQAFQDVVARGGFDPSLRPHLTKMAEYENIPRKAAKFKNWCKNSLRLFDGSTVDALFGILTAAHKEATNPTPMEEKIGAKADASQAVGKADEISKEKKLTSFIDQVTEKKKTGSSDNSKSPADKEESDKKKKKSKKKKAKKEKKEGKREADDSDTVDAKPGDDAEDAEDANPAKKAKKDKKKKKDDKKDKKKKKKDKKSDKS